MDPETPRLTDSTVVPVFPLPNVVLFPGTLVPLHIFEPRYRSMVRDSSRGGGLIGMALLRPGYEEEHEGSPAIHEIGTVGRIEQLEPMADGRFTLNLLGLQRVEYHEIPSDRPYRLARVTALPEQAVDESDPRIQQAKLDLLAGQALLQRELSDEGEPPLIIHEHLSYTVAVNGACANLPVPAEIRLELLMLDDPRERQVRASALLSEVLEKVLRLKSEGTPQDRQTN